MKPAEHMPASNTEVTSADTDGHGGQREFPVRVTEHFSRLANTPEPKQALLKQFLPDAAEYLAEKHSGFNQDPTGEQSHLVMPGLIQKYDHQALIITTAACPIHCRYCFRRHFPYSSQQLKTAQWHAMLGYLNQHREITEIIFSGGDPLSLSTGKLRSMYGDLAELAHIRRIRIHSRYPIVDPRRIDGDFVRFIREAAASRRVVLVIHCNHPDEISDAAAAAMTALKPYCLLLNQSVLLKGVNDDAAILQSLSEKLFDIGVMPYYLHKLDKVSGAAHFEVDGPRTRALYNRLKTTLPGYLVPKLVTDHGGRGGKTHYGDLGLEELE